MTESEFQRGIAVLIAGVGRPMPAETVDIWREMLIDLSFDEFKRGVANCLKNYTYAGFPPIGVIRQAAGAGTGIADAESAALAAWDKVLHAIRAIGGYRSIRWNDPAIPVAIEIIAGSWAQLCDTPSDELHAFRRPQFIKAYASARAMRIERPAVCTGILAADAGRLGFDAPEPVSLGNQIKRVEGFANKELPALPGPAEELAGSIGRLPPPKPESPVNHEAIRRKKIQALRDRYPQTFTTREARA